MQVILQCQTGSRCAAPSASDIWCFSMKLKVTHDPFGEGLYVGLQQSKDGIAVDPVHIRHLLSAGLTCLWIHRFGHDVYGVTRHFGSPIQESMVPLERIKECCADYFREEVAPLAILLYESRR